MAAKLKIEKGGDEILIVQLEKFLFLVTVAILNGGRGCRTQF
jgi:hypothetical protein